jgi:hypothetical protein
MPNQTRTSAGYQFPYGAPNGLYATPPPLFTVVTETMADLANQELQTSAPSAPNRLDTVFEVVGPALEFAPEFAPISSTSSPTVPVFILTKTHGRPQHPVKLWDVYVNDFAAMPGRIDEECPTFGLAAGKSYFDRISDSDSVGRGNHKGMKKSPLPTAVAKISKMTRSMNQGFNQVIHGISFCPQRSARTIMMLLWERKLLVLEYMQM